MAKHSLRQVMLARRNQIDEESRRNLSLRVQQTLIDASCFQLAQTLALYSPINNEVQTEEILAVALRAGKQVYFPKVDGDYLQFCHVNSAADLSANY